MTLSFETPDDAKKATRQAAYAGFASAALTAGLVAIAARVGGEMAALFDPFSLIDVVLMAGLATGLLLRQSRACAIALLTLYLLGQVVVRMNGASTAGVGMAFVFIWFYGRGILGAFAYHRMKGDPAPPAAPALT